MIRKNKKALSEVVSTVLIIGVTVLVGAVVWVVVSGIVGDQLDEGEACFGVLDQVQINRDYTCYNPTTNKMQFSLSVGDLDIDAILVSVSYEGTSKSATLNGTLQTITDVGPYPSGIGQVKMPSKNGGSTYFFNGITSMPVSISMIPVIKGKQCGSTDVLREIIDCNALIS